jgi:type I restriction enzyme, S subunit
LIKETWRTATLEQICLKITDGAHSSPPSQPVGLPMASVKDMTRFGLNLNSARRIGHEDFSKLVRQGCMPELGDVLIAKDGATALDTVCEIKKPVEVVLLSSIAIFRPDQGQITSSFLRYYLDAQPTRQYMKGAFISGAAIPRVVLTDFKRVQVYLPPLHQQLRIASILSAYDDLIENNIRRIAILEEMARRLYEEWFVRFHFPGHEQVRMVKSDLGLIPEGWKITKLGDLFQFVGGAQPPKSEHIYEHLPGYIRFVQNRDYSSSRHLTYICESKKNKVCDRLDIMIDKYGEAGKTRFGVAGAYNVALAKILPNTAHYREWLRGFLSRDEFRQYLASASQAATRASLNSAHFNVPVAVPGDELLLQLEQQVVPMLKLILNYQDAIFNLRAQRDLLLPKLISGEIDVSAFPAPEAIAA